MCKSLNMLPIYTNTSHWSAFPFKSLFGKGVFLTFNGCEMEGFVAIEERPTVSRDIGPGGGVLTTDYDPQLEANIPKGTVAKSSKVKMTVSR